MALVCETVTANTMADLRRARDASSADVVELRLDGVADADVAGALADRRGPVIVTCRAAWEGGRFAGSEEERLAMLRRAVALGAEYVDVEWRADRRDWPAGASTQVVLSHHDFDGVPADARDRLRAMRREAPEAILKMAVMTRAARECVGLRDLARDDAGRHAIIGMGATGLITRTCPWLFGSEWTYGGDAAPGQLPVRDLQTMYRVTSGGPARRLFALTGAPLAHSASPAMQNAALAAKGIDAAYVPIESADGAEFLHVAEAFGIEGASVTAPLKTVWPSLGVALDPSALAIGAANTLRHRDGRWEARNFDGDGFLEPLRRRGIALAGRRCVVLGAGGAARAVAWALRDAGADVEIAARRPDQAASLATALGVGLSSAWPPAPGWALLVNATPAGTSPHIDASPIPREAVRGDVVYDLVYHPRQTRLLTWAAEAGAATIDGLEMLVGQACRQFEFWWDLAAPRDVMTTAAEQFLAHAAEQDRTRTA